MYIIQNSVKDLAIRNDRYGLFVPLSTQHLKKFKHRCLKDIHIFLRYN